MNFLPSDGSNAGVVRAGERMASAASPACGPSTFASILLAQVAGALALLAVFAMFEGLELFTRDFEPHVSLYAFVLALPMIPVLLAWRRASVHLREEAAAFGALAAAHKQVELDLWQRASELAAVNEHLEQEIAARQDLEKKLVEAHQDLERKFKERSNEASRSHESLKLEIESRQKLENQLRQAQKMEAVGHLAGGIAHDFNNLLTVINGHTEALFRGLGADYRSAQRVQEIARASGKAERLTRQLLAFSRQQILRPRVLDLNELVKDFQRMLGRLIGENIIFATKLCPELNAVKVDPGQIEQVLLNLAVNARDAMPKGGRLLIETANVELDALVAARRPEVKPGHYVVLAVSDTGCGMDRATLARVFEPFFTTKEPGKGTGLGLATCYGIVKQSGGYIYVYSEPNQGTSFKVYLPITDEVPSVTLPKRSQPVAEGTETLLVVEDEEGVRSMLRSSLKEHGYTVLEAADGTEALSLVRQYPHPIALLLTDVVMPEMGGRALAEHMAILRPETKVLFTSGYTDDMVMRNGVLEAEVEFIQKPYTLNDLLARIREIIDRGPDSRSSARTRQPAMPV